jgi:signal transduction histidine kinase
MSRKSLSLLFVVFIASVALIAVNFYTIKILSSLRAYIVGESQYSKGQKDALLYLSTYLQTEDSVYWRSFNEAIKTPEGDNEARQLLTKNADFEKIAFGFLKGKNHQKDVPDMIWLFRTFHNVSFMNSAIKIWSDAEPLINELDSIGAGVRAKIENHQLQLADKQETMKRISDISSRLSAMEGAFSEVLGSAARKIKVYLLLVNVFCIIFILGNIMMFAIKMVKKISISEDILQAKNVQLTASNKELDTLLHSISHDMRSPITSMKGLVELINNEKDPEEIKNYLLLMDTVIDKQNIFITETIDFFKNKHQAAVCADIDMTDLVESIIMNNRFTPAAQSIVFSHEIKAGAVRSDELRLKMILNNLLSNAIKYSDDGKTTKTVTVKTDQIGEWYYIEVEDNGIGMDNRYLGKIFDMYYVIPGNKKGTGLGLYILKENVDKLNGTIEVESELTKGTKFTVAIPCS